ncbi:MAG: PaaI family thioesterase [Syntrophomonadaceae bacterium]|nr:PaaI family thioesterase [Syntrophomonadaceae bacterium]
MRELNPEHVKAVIDLINQAPYFKLLSMVVKDLGVGYSTVEIDIGKKHLNPFEGVHGGVYTSIIDTAAYWAAYCELNENLGLITLDLQVSCLAPVKGGKLISRGSRIKMGRTICLAEAVAADQKGKIVAHGTSKLLVTQGLQTIDQIIIATGSQPLPPKFII